MRFLLSKLDQCARRLARREIFFELGQARADVAHLFHASLKPCGRPR